MQIRTEICGLSPIVHHNGEAGLDAFSPVSQEIAEIAAKRGGNKTVSDVKRLRELEAQRSLYLETPEGPATLPESMIRTAVESGARKLKQGPLVREGLVVVDAKFVYDRARYGTTPEELGQSTQFTCGVVVQRSRILRTRAKFDLPWSCIIEFDVDRQQIDTGKLQRWLEIAGQRIGIGDWRPEKSGSCGRFDVVSMSVLN